ncbi:hypothetical protein AX16_009514 [Volvariella volvacea WC 439]|nr:hypothetical protein AX16_009514 [Volvariella volvacea WC 439]
MSSFPDYYQLLNIPRTASQDEVRQAYKRESLKTHPDRLLNATPDEKRKATESFQAIADAYHILSDPPRRKEYDRLYNSSKPETRTTSPEASSGFFSQFAGMFTSSGAAAGADQTNNDRTTRPNAEGVFADVFEEMLRPEVERHAPWWSYVGTVCGGGMGFIVANIPGMVLGAYAGNKLGAVRDAKGKSVAQVFSELGGTQKAEILRALAVKVLGAALT